MATPTPSRGLKSLMCKGRINLFHSKVKMWDRECGGKRKPVVYTLADYSVPRDTDISDVNQAAVIDRL